MEEGQEVEIQADAFEGETFSGTVTNVSMEGTSSNGVTYYPVTVTLNESGSLLPGMNVDGTIITASAEQVLSVPSGALQRGNAVYVKDDSAEESQGPVPAGFKQFQVETGLISSDYVEIVSGDLEEGDEVYVSSDTQESAQQPADVPGGMNGMGGGGFEGGGFGGGGMEGGPGGGRQR